MKEIKKTVFVKSKEVNNQSLKIEARKPFRGYPKGYNGSYRNYLAKRYFDNRNQSFRTYKSHNKATPYACFFCNKIGHIEKYCYFKKYKLSRNLVKSYRQTSLNFQGPKLV